MFKKAAIFSSFFLLTTATATSQAHDSKVKSHHYWKGSNASFGFNEATGNTNTSSLNTGLNLDYTRGRWQEDATLTANYGKENGTLSQEKYFVQNQLNYSLNKDNSNYVFVNGSSTFDHFSPYNYQLNTAGGYGRQLVNTDKYNWKLQVGPGYGRTKERDNHKITNEVTLNPQTSISWQITKNNSLKETASATISKPFNYYKSVTSFTNNILKHLATSINFQIDYYSKLPPSTDKLKNTDTTTSVNLVYTF